jgi:hypothetical protein
MRRTIWGLIVGGNHYPLLMATNVWALPTIAGRPCPLSFPLSLPLIQGLNAPIIGFIGLLPGLLVILIIILSNLFNFNLSNILDIIILFKLFF